MITLETLKSPDSETFEHELVLFGQEELSRGRFLGTVWQAKQNLRDLRKGYLENVYPMIRKELRTVPNQRLLKLK